MNLGTFSISLAVKDMDASLAFYQALGFEVIDGGHMRENMPDSDTTSWRILQNGTAVVGLFVGMFEGNMMTFNPPDVRASQAALKAADVGVTFQVEASAEGNGPAHAVVTDPDGNVILLDQHGDTPESD